MHRRQARGDLSCQRQRALNGKRTFCENGAEIVAFQQIHHQIGPAVFGLVEVDDLNDVGMAQLGRYRGFAAEPLQSGLISREIDVQDLQRVPSAQPGVPRFEHLAHRAAADVTDDAISIAQLLAGLQRPPFRPLARTRSRNGVIGTTAPRIGVDRLGLLPVSFPCGLPGRVARRFRPQKGQRGADQTRAVLAFPDVRPDLAPGFRGQGTQGQVQNHLLVGAGIRRRHREARVSFHQHPRGDAITIRWGPARGRHRLDARAGKALPIIRDSSIRVPATESPVHATAPARGRDRPQRLPRRGCTVHVCGLRPGLDAHAFER